jgi:hypothetical protein
MTRTVIKTRISDEATQICVVKEVIPKRERTVIKIPNSNLFLVYLTTSLQLSRLLIVDSLDNFLMMN